MENYLLIITLGSLVIFSAGLIQGITSFGFSLFALPLLSIFIDFKLVVPMLVIYSLVMNSIILFKIRKYIKIKSITLLILFGILFTPIGTKILINVDENLMKMGVGLIVTITAISFYFGYKVKIKNEKLAYIQVGMLSGILNGSVSLSGPPVVLFLTNQGVEKQVFRATLTAYFWIINIITIFIFTAEKLITTQLIKFSSYLLPALIIGVFLGIRLGNKVKENTFKKFTTILIIITGILSLITGTIYYL